MSNFTKLSPNESAARKPALSRPASHKSGPSAVAGGPVLQRKPACACGGSCPSCKAATASLAHDAGKGQTAPAGRSAIPPIVHKALNSAGQSLDPQTRAYFEPRFGQDFSHVHVHTGALAADSAQSIGATAYTAGSDIVFRTGHYAPHTETGRHTLAHELAHVVQQRQADTSTPLELGAPGDAYEREADTVAAAVLAGGNGMVATPSPLAARRIQRQTDSGFESSSGVGSAISAGTMTTVSGVHGTTFSTGDCFGQDDCQIDMRFEKAYQGDYNYGAAGGRSVRGVYVKIAASYPGSCWHCQPLELIQVVRNITKASGGNMVTADPGTATRRERSGWNNATAPSRGWRVDRLESATDPLFTHGANGNPGNDSTPAILWDAPGDWSTDRNAGKEFQTIALCGSGSQMIPLASVTWGYFIDSSGTISFRPATPTASCSGTTQLTDSAARWNAISGNTRVNLASGSPPRGLGDYPMPPGGGSNAG